MMQEPHIPFQRVGVLMGGISAEREISLKSGQAVLASLQRSNIDAFAIDLEQNWASKLASTPMDAAFIALHGTWGEDGCVQGLLETLSIPYTGSGITASALCMNKILTKRILQQAGLSVAVDVPIHADGPIRYPVFVKPIAEGSSVGLHHVFNAQQWDALNITNTQQWMAEMPAVGVEVAVSVMHHQALAPVEVSPKSGVYDFTSKYTVGATSYFCPARLPAETLRLCMEYAEQAVQATQCRGAARVDMIVCDGGQPLILEINTIPGMTETSLLPKAAAAAGINFDSLCLQILASASLEHGGKL